MRELIEDLRLSRISYLLEKIEKSNIDEKIKSFKKIEKYKITKKIGLYLIENSTRDYNIDDEFGGVSSSLIELCFKNYYPEYTEKISEIFEKLNPNAQNRVLFLLTTIKNKDTLELYTDLVLKYYKDDRIIPIGNLSENPYAYNYLFPKLFKMLKYGISKYNILILLNNYINSGIVSKDDITKNKKLILEALYNIFEEALKYKFKTTYEGLNDINYKSLRYFLEIAISLELQISNKKTKDYLQKILKKHDNQIKLFILDNYFKKGTKIDKINFNEIARDKSSRYALFELLNIYDRLDLMPKKYLNQKLLAESEFYTSFIITTGYTYEPTDLTFYKIIDKNDLDFYAFKFKYKHKFNNYNSDYLTNYICSQIGVEKYNNEEITSDFIGLSGGYIKGEKVTPICKSQEKLLCAKIDDLDEEQIENVINELLIEKKIEVENTNKKKKDKKQKKTKENKFKLIISNIKNKFSHKKDKKIKVKKEKNTEVKKENKFKLFIARIKNKRLNKKEIVKPKKEKIPKVKKEYEIVKTEEEKVEEEPKKSYHIFSYILLFLFAVFLSLLIYWMLYVYGVGSMNDGISEKAYKEVKLENSEKFVEINGTDIFKQEDSEYFVLLYNGATNKSDKYYVYLNEYLKRDYKFYFVDTRKEENKFLYSANEINFIIYTDRLLKVKDHEYEYYVDGKTNILNEMENDINNLKNIEKKKQKEEQKKVNAELKASKKSKTKK